MTTVNYRFKVRGGTAANLAAVNEIPLARELIVETNTGKMKLGDGVQNYNDLDYMGPGAAGGGGPYPTANFHGDGSDITVGAFCDLFIPFEFQITRAVLLGDAVGTLQVDVRKASYASFPPTSGDSICGGTPPALTLANKYSDDTLSGWTTTVAPDSVLRFVVTACSGVQQAQLLLEGVRP